MFGTMKI